MPDLSELQQFYDEKYAKGYMGKDCYGTWSHSGAQLLRVLDTLGQVSIVPDRILDYGCGQGAWIDILSRCFPRSQVCGIDISSLAIEKAKSQFPLHDFRTFNGTQADFPDEHFDLIYSYHVLEHVINIEASIGDICRMLKRGGHACIIFPCGNPGSFEEKTMNLMDGGVTITSEGRKVYLYEQAVGHLRRMTSMEAIELFGTAGLTLVAAFYSNQFFGWVDWLVRAHDRNTINSLLSGEKAITYSAKVRLVATKKALLALNWIVAKKSLDLSKRRSLPKTIAAHLLKFVAITIDTVVVFAAISEWRLFKHKWNGSEQFLVFQKSAEHRAGGSAYLGFRFSE